MRPVDGESNSHDDPNFPFLQKPFAAPVADFSSRAFVWGRLFVPHRRCSATFAGLRCFMTGDAFPLSSPATAKIGLVVRPFGERTLLCSPFRKDRGFSALSGHKRRVPPERSSDGARDAACADAAIFSYTAASVWQCIFLRCRTPDSPSCRRGTCGNSCVRGCRG